MTNKLILSFLLFLLAWQAHAQVQAFKIFDSTGKETSFESLAKKSGEVEIIFFGELHNNSMAHWLQLQLLKHLQQQGKDLVLAAEFFERDDQLTIDEWMVGKMSDKTFETEAKLWNNYLTDYKPLLLFAKKNSIPFVGSNIPRKYASLVSREGLESLAKLSEEAKSYIAPLPVTVDKSLPGYAGMRDMMHGSGMNLDFMIEAQAIKDATMAYSLEPFLSKGKTILHVNGSYHSNNYEGILWYVWQKNPKVKILTINTIEQDDLNSIDENTMKTADFIIVTPLDIPKSY